MKAWLLAFLLSAVAGTVCGEDFQYDAFVLRDYAPRRENLEAWEASARIIQASLNKWGNISGGIQINRSPVVLEKFLQQTPGEGKRRVVYLAAHQSPDGRWDFPGQGLVAWKGWLPDSHAIVIVDACHAAAVLPGKENGLMLCASSPSELTSALVLGARRPIDLESRYPEAVEWIRKELGPDTREISFLGFAWVRALLETPVAPQTDEEWKAFFHRVAECGAEMKSPRPPDIRSTISY